MVNRLSDALQRLARKRFAWWIWPAFLVLFALTALASSLVLSPGPDEFCYLPNGARFGDECGFTMVTGLPCPQCGMTRSFVHGVRFHWIQAFLYNPAGFALFLWIQAAGVVGAVRLATKNPRAWMVPPGLFFGWSMFWLIVLYVIPFGLRIGFQINPLP